MVSTSSSQWPRRRLVWVLIRWTWLKLMVAVTEAQDCINNQPFDSTLSIHVTCDQLYAVQAIPGRKKSNKITKVISPTKIVGRMIDLNNTFCIQKFSAPFRQTDSIYSGLLENNLEFSTRRRNSRDSR